MFAALRGILALQSLGAMVVGALASGYLVSERIRQSAKIGLLSVLITVFVVLLRRSSRSVRWQVKTLSRNAPSRTCRLLVFKVTYV